MGVDSGSGKLSFSEVSTCVSNFKSGVDYAAEIAEVRNNTRRAQTTSLSFFPPYTRPLPSSTSSFSPAVCFLRPLVVPSPSVAVPPSFRVSSFRHITSFTSAITTGLILPSAFSVPSSSPSLRVYRRSALLPCVLVPTHLFHLRP